VCGWPAFLKKGNRMAPLLINEFQNIVLGNDFDGFYIVKRHNNPLRKYALVHQDLGKIGAVKPCSVVNLASRLVGGMLPQGRPLVVGLSESSILLGRVVCEFFGGGCFIFSTRYPHDISKLVAFSEPHSHSPSQYLHLSMMESCKEVCIVEDEITTGNTIINLVEVLSKNLPSVRSISVYALKVLCSNGRIAEMREQAYDLKIKLLIRSLYRGKSPEEGTRKYLQSTPFQSLIECACYSDLERGRGRIDLFNEKTAAYRYRAWNSFLDRMAIPQNVNVIGASEAIDLAFEISQVLARRGHKAFLRHLTISPWEVPGWIFYPSVPGTKPLHLYMPPHRGGTYILIYDQPFQEEQIQRLAECLQNICAKTFIIKGVDFNADNGRV